MTTTTASNGSGERTDDGRHDERVTPMVVLRTETCATLNDLDAAAKGRASIVRSCSEAQGLSQLHREALKDLLRCITEQRKRLRALRRVWQSMDAYERPSADLVGATELCLRESQEMAAALEPLRMQTIGRVSDTVGTTWARLMLVAAQFMPEQHGSLRLVAESSGNATTNAVAAVLRG